MGDIPNVQKLSFHVKAMVGSPKMISVSKHAEFKKPKMKLNNAKTTASFSGKVTSLLTINLKQNGGRIALITAIDTRLPVIIKPTSC